MLFVQYADLVSGQEIVCNVFEMPDGKKALPVSKTPS